MAWSMPSPTPASSWSSSARKEGVSDAVVRIRSRDRSRLASAAVRGLATSCAITLGWRTNSARASGSGRRGRLTTGGWSTRPRQRPASSSVIRSRLRRSTPSGGGAAGCLLTGATHQGPVSSSRQPTQRLPWMIGAPQRWRVLSRSRRVSGDWELTALVRTGITSARDETSHRVTARPWRATLASRKTSRRCSGIRCHEVWDQWGPVLGRFCGTEGCECDRVVSPSALTLATPFSLWLPLRSPAGDHDAVAALPLRLVHRRVGARDELLRRLPVRRILGGTHAHRHPPATEFFSRHARPEALAHGGGRRDRRLDQHDQELLTAVTGHAVDTACGLAQDLRDLHEHRVPPEVPVRVVVLLEVIDVGQQHGEGAPQAARPLDLVGERPHEMPPVIQPGEPVGDGEPLQLALALPLPHAGCQVLEHLRQLADLAATAHRELDRRVAGGHLSRHPREASERAYDEQSDGGGQPTGHQQHDEHHTRPASPARLAQRLRPWHLHHRGPAERRHPP